MTELSESTSHNNVVKLPPPTPISAWPYQPEDLLPLSEVDALNRSVMDGKIDSVERILLS